MPRAETFQAPISPADRVAAWAWRWSDGQPADQHVRDHLMADDGAVLAQMRGQFIENSVENTGGWERF